MRTTFPPPERRRPDRTKQRREKRRRFPKFSVAKDASGAARLTTEHDDQATGQALELDAFGLATTEELSAILRGVLNYTTTSDGEIDGGSAAEALQLIAGMQPENTTEALLATQMAAVHLATMDAARRMHRTPLDVEVVAVNSKVLNNLARTFAAQVEAMKSSGRWPAKGSGRAQALLPDARRNR